MTTSADARAPRTAGQLADIFPGADQASALARETDWSATKLGSPGQWSPELCAAIRTVLPSKVPMLLWWGPDLVQVYNEAFRPLLGSKHPTAMGQCAAECWPEVWQELEPLVTTVLYEGESTYAQELLLFLDRHGYTEETYWTFSYSPIRAADGAVLGIFVATTDVSAQVIQARRLGTVHALAVVSSAEMASPEAVCEHALRIMSGNRKALPFAAVYLRDAADGLVLTGCYGIERSDHALPERIELHSDHPYARVAVHRRADVVTFGPGDDLRAERSPLGPAVPTHATVLPLRAGSVRASVGVLVLGANPYRPLDDSYRSFHDLITRQLSALLADARATQDERDRAAALAELDAAKTAFFQNVSHEFRTPLTIAMAATRELQRAAQDAESAAHVDAAQRAVQRLNRLVDALLEFARAEAGTLVPVAEAIDVGAFTRDLVSMFRSAVEDAGLALVLDVPETGEAWLDPEAWAKIVVNLVSNAFKFTAAGSVSVTLRRLGDDVVLSVADTGTGIAPEERDRVFERFHQVRRAPLRGAPGVGIGLALVGDLVGALGGEVCVTSEVGVGSTFTVTVPAGRPTVAAVPRSSQERDLPALAAPLVDAAAPVRDPSPPAVPAHAAHSARLLLVEDNSDLRGYLTRLLASDRWQVTAVGDVPAALAVEEVPDLVLSDIMLPGQSGLDLVRLLRGDPRMATVPIILLSARAGSDAAAEGLAAGADDYVVKPFEPVELLSRLRVHHQLAVGRARALDRAEARADTLEVALLTSRRIGMALGILMARRQLTSDDAFDLLRRYSTDHNIKLRDVAEDVLLTGELPG